MPSSEDLAHHLKEGGQQTRSNKTHVESVVEINLYDFMNTSPK
jgi:hypothetical protein